MLSACYCSIVGLLEKRVVTGADPVSSTKSGDQIITVLDPTSCVGIVFAGDIISSDFVSRKSRVPSSAVVSVVTTLAIAGRAKFKFQCAVRTKDLVAFEPYDVSQFSKPIRK